MCSGYLSFWDLNPNENLDNKKEWAVQDPCTSISSISMHDIEGISRVLIFPLEMAEPNINDEVANNPETSVTQKKMHTDYFYMFIIK